MLPTGNLREPRCGARRADAVIVTKTPNVFSPLIYREILKKLKLRNYQKVFFSCIVYKAFLPVPGINAEQAKKDYNTILMFSGIANSYPMQEHLKTKCFELIVLDFPDHHKYSDKDIEKITATFDEIFSVNKCIVTTEKDAMRLIKSELINLIKNYPVYYIPIENKFHKKEDGLLDEMIIEYVGKSKRGNKNPSE
jgi:tetraacyldisaccharide 4'-kinase